ncbi:MAG: flagellin lysine-N-methylase [Ruminococcus sp.]|uniref:flagellin lysine-N-methylase n=1 Tax=Ruminococcus sp. TaxID=41978 RepID=UPI0028731E49|nr:flagellin lysine-N-methylase [Ruminococcus sp.]MBQ3284570.1 flagellin lysine-N-methylase [Ruminococcus sp.]
MTMKHYYPTYYQDFRCIAADCPDSCCQGWDVVIDSDAEQFYNTVQGEFGEKLREAIITDADGDRVFRLAENKKCPFWGADRLCDIYRALGEEHLCATCARFPRITMDYTVFTEHTLALACPEAARLILTTDGAYADFYDIQAKNCEDYDAETMRLLLNVRKRAADILTQRIPLEERFERILRAAAEAQRAKTGVVFDPAGNDPDVFEQLEYIDEKNRLLFVLAAEKQPDFSRYERELTNLSLYWLYRYLLGAINDGNIMAAMRFLTVSVGIVANLAAESGDIIAAAQTYSKEIEQSYENIEELGVRS